jgi:DNA polymerase III epsilon subunit-like protein
MIKGRSKETRDNLFIAVKEHKPIVVYDLETTGLDAKLNRIIQFSAKKVMHDGERFIELGNLNSFINPEVPIPAKITEITGIKDEDVMNAPTETEFFPQLKEFFGNGFVASGFNNAKFDNKFMINLYERQSCKFNPDFTVDVIEMARDNVDKKETENFKLGTIAKLYGADRSLTFHNATDDVTATTRLLYVFYEEYKGSYEEDEGLTSSPDCVQVQSVTRIRFWEGYSGFSRLYITTNIGEVFFDIRNKVWGVNSSTPYSIDEIDIGSLRRKTFEKAKVSSESELVKKFTPHKEKSVLKPTCIINMKRWEKTTTTGNIKRIYVLTDVGNFFYDLINKRWFSNSDNPNEIIDEETLKQLAFAKAKVVNEEQFAAFGS